MTVGRKILLVDDDVALRHSLAEQLRLHEEFLPEEAEDGAKALALVGQQYFDAILLDVGLPDMDGRELCRLMRRSGVRSPIPHADRRRHRFRRHSRPRFRCQRLHHQAVPPLSPARQAARPAAPARAERGRRLHHRPLHLPAEAKLLVGGEGRKKVRLTEKETAILKYLYRAGPKVIGRDTLLGEVWGYNAGVTTHTLETHIYRLRQKIEREPARAEILVTEPGGYRLVP